MSFITINLDIISVIASFITTNEVFNIISFNEIANLMLNDIEKKKLTILLNILSNILTDDKLDINPITFSKSFGAIINSFIGILQVFFCKINLDDFTGKLSDWLENDNENEQHYLFSANIAKKTYELIDIFNKQTKKGFIIQSTTMFLKDIDDKKHLMIKCYFTPEI